MRQCKLCEILDFILVLLESLGKLIHELHDDLLLLLL